MSLYPGAPNLLRNLPKAVIITVLGNAVNSLWNFLFPGPQWGIFVPGEADHAVEVSSVVSLSISATARASDYPIQTGSFTNYNKVRLPDIFSVVVTCDGDEQKRSEFLQWLETEVSATSTFDVVCPEKRWPNSTLTDYRIDRRQESGATMIIAECIFQQIRELPATFSNSNIANPEDQERTGTVRVEPIINVEPNSAGGEVQWQ